MDIHANDRNQKEDDFFTQGKWGTLPSGTYGVDSLVAKLSVLLYDHITDYFPQLLKEIKEELERSEEELHALGRRVDTESEMLSEVSTLFSRSQTLIKSGISGYYPDQRDFLHVGDSEDSVQISSRNLRARIRRENNEFEKEIRMRGCQVRLVGKGMPEKGDDDPEDTDSEDSFSKMEDYETKTVQHYLDTYVGQHLPGDYDPLIVYQLFADYSVKWDNIARSHRDRILGIANEFLQQVVNSVWPQRMRTQLWSTLLSKKIELLQIRAKEELEKLLLDRRRCSPIYGPEYPRRLKELQNSSAPDRIPPAREVLQRMLVYYELTSKTFVSNVIVQVVERHLIDGLHTVFDTAELIQMDKQTVTELAAEDKHNRTKRDDLERKVMGLKRAHDDCLAISMANGQKKVQEHEPHYKQSTFEMVCELTQENLKDQQSEPDMVNTESKEDLDRPPPPQGRHRKHANTEPNGRYTPPVNISRNTTERTTVIPRRRPSTKVRKTESKSVAVRGHRQILIESESDADRELEPEKRNGVTNRGALNRSSNKDPVLVRAMQLFSDDNDDDEDLAF